MNYSDVVLSREFTDEVQQALGIGRGRVARITIGGKLYDIAPGPIIPGSLKFKTESTFGVQPKPPKPYDET